MIYRTWLIIKKTLIVLFLFLVSNFSFPVYIHASNNNDSSEVIKAIEVQGLTRIEQKELIDLICLDVGDVLDREILSAGIRRAFKKGIFLDIKTISEPYDDGIKIKYIVRKSPVIKKITVNGNEYVSTEEIKNKFLLKKDEDFKGEFLNKARRVLLDFYKRKGFPDAAVTIEVENAKEPSMVNIHINVIEGAPLIIKRIDMPDDVRKHLTVYEGDIFDRDILDKNIKRLRDYYKKKNYIKPVIGPYEFRENNLIIPVSKGPKLKLVFQGNSVISTRKLRKEVPFINDEEVSDELIQEAVKRIRRLYLSKGYYYVQIAASVDREEEKIKVSFFIVEGGKVILKKISFEGIKISTEAIKGIIQLKEDRPYNENLLTTSKESIVNFYNALGYLEMEISDIKKDFRKEGSELNLKFIIKEGPQTKIKSINITGNKHISKSEIKRVLRISEKAPYNVIDIRDARYRVLSLYNKYGYLDAHVTVESEIKGEDAVIYFKITENRPYVIGKVILRGNKKTKAKIIWREFFIKEGDPLNYEELLKTKQRLYKLGLFNEIAIDMFDSNREIDNKPVKDVVVSLKEGRAGSVEIGLGYGDYEKFRGSLDIRYNNLGGYNRQIGLRIEVSSVEKRYIFNFREPWLFNEPAFPLNAFLMKEDKRAVNLDTNEVLYKIDRISLLINIEKELTERLKANLNYEYSFVDTKDVEPGVILSKEDTGTIAIGSISPSLFYDTRDNPFNPTSGSINGIVLKFASEAFLSETEFIKGTFQSSWFFQLKKGIVFAFSLRGGAAYSFDDTKELPLVERFFLGGRTTVRGYSRDTLGPKGDDDTPTGGNVFTLMNGEFRISLGKGFGLVTFLDAGNVWTLADDIDNRLKYTAGAGLRYNTPVGPIRVDYGHKLNKEENESSGEIHFSFGHAF